MRLFSSVVVAASLGMGLAQCGSFGSNAPTETPDGSSPPSDGASPPADADASATTPKCTLSETALCDDFDHGEPLGNRWGEIMNASVDGADFQSPPRSLAINMTAGTPESYVAQRLKGAPKLRLELDLKVTTTEPTGEVDVVLIELYQPVDYERYAVGLIRQAGGKWIAQRVHVAKGQSSSQYLAEPLVANFDDWRHVVFDVTLDGADPHVLVTVGSTTSRLALLPATAAGFDLKLGAPWRNQLTAAWNIRFDDVQAIVTP